MAITVHSVSPSYVVEAPSASEGVANHFISTSSSSSEAPVNTWLLLELREPPVPPGLRIVDPDSGAIGVDPNTLIVFDIYDQDEDIDGYDAYVDGAVAWDRFSGFQYPYNGTHSSVSNVAFDGYDGYRITIDKTFPYGFSDSVVVRAVVDDTADYHLDETWSFSITNGVAPQIANRDPAPGATSVDPDTVIVFDVYDQNGDIDSYDAYVEGALAWDSEAGLFIAPYDGPLSSVSSVIVDGYDGYHVLLQRTSDFVSYEPIEVRVRVKDSGGNLLDQTYGFRIRDYTGALFADIFPTPYSDNNPRNALIEFDVYDPDSGLDLATLRVYIDGNTAYDGYGFLPPYDGYGSEVMGPFLIDGYDGYHIAIQSTGDYPSGGTVHVDVIIDNEEGN